MSTYELDDDRVKALLGDPNAPHLGESGAVILQALREQIPIPAPDGLGAVVRTVDGLYVRADLPDDDRVDAPWFSPNNTSWHTDTELPRITEVLHPGV